MSVKTPTPASIEDLNAALQALTIGATKQWSEEVHQSSVPVETPAEDISQAEDLYIHLSTVFPSSSSSPAQSSKHSQTIDTDTINSRSTTETTDFELYAHKSDMLEEETASLLHGFNNDAGTHLEGSGKAPLLSNSFGQSIRQKLRFMTRPVVPLTPRDLKSKRGFKMFGERMRDKSEQEKERERDRAGREVLRGRILVEVD